jgi:hypothetical protein
MGDIADMMLEGTLCEQCGVYLNNDRPGHPRCCADCAEDPEIEKDYKDRIVNTD